MNIDLQRYSANDSDCREHLRKPWRAGEWVYATNGHLAVRVPAASFPDAQENAKAPTTIGDLFARAFDSKAPSDFRLMPDLQPLKKCGWCKGKGRMHSIKCPDCDDDGEFMHGHHTYTCQECEHDPAGPGRLECSPGDEGANETACSACYGLGYQSRDNGRTNIGDAHYSTVYLHMLAELPQVAICPGEPASTAIRPTAAALSFDGGQAILMPYR